METVVARDPIEINGDSPSHPQNENHNDICDLCNMAVPVTEIDEHMIEFHSVLHRWCEDALTVQRAEVLAADIPHNLAQPLGEFVVANVAHLDKGPRAFDVIRRAVEQMNVIIPRFEPNTSVFLFGSCVSVGSWDGAADADFTMLRQDRLSEGRWPPPDEADIIVRIAAALRKAGFLFEEIRPIRRTRVPVVKREQKCREPLRLPTDDDDFQIIHMFECRPSMVESERWQNTLIKDGAQVEVLSDRRMAAHFSSATLALDHYCKRVHAGEPSKEWRGDCPLPEIFSLDFDISCRPFGVRNSWFLRKYLSQLPEARAGNAFIKRWSKKSGVNNSSRGYITSYAVTVLWVHYLLQKGVVSFVDPASVPLEPTMQQLDVPYLPLFNNDPDTAAKPNSEKEAEKEKKAEAASVEENERKVEAASAAAATAVDDATKALAVPLGNLILGFFRYFVEFEWDRFAVSLRTPSGIFSREALGWVTENETMTWLMRDRVWYRMCIDDPYEENFNLGRHLSPRKTAFVQTQFVRALSALLRGAASQLLTDERALAAEVLRATLFRIVAELGGDDAKLLEADARRALRQRVGEQVMAFHEVERMRLVPHAERSRAMGYISETRELTVGPFDASGKKISMRQRRRFLQRERDAQAKALAAELANSEAAAAEAVSATPNKMDEAAVAAAGNVDGAGAKLSKEREEKDGGTDTTPNKKKRQRWRNRKAAKIKADADAKQSKEETETAKNQENEKMGAHGANESVAKHEVTETKREEFKKDSGGDAMAAGTEAEDDEEECDALLPPVDVLLREIDDKVRAAGAMGLPAAANIPKGLHEAYYIAFDRAFLTLEAKNTFYVHADAVGSALAERPSQTREAVHRALANYLPDAVRVDALIDSLLLDDGAAVREAVSSASRNDTPPAVVRTKRFTDGHNSQGRVGAHRGQMPMRRADMPVMATCSECGVKNILVWATQNPKKDFGRYCLKCWEKYEATFALPLRQSPGR